MVLLTCPKDELFKPSKEHKKISEKSEIKAVKASDLRRAGFPFLLAGGSSMSDVVVPRIGYLTSSQFVWSFLWKTLRISRYRTFTASFWHWKLNSAISEKSEIKAVKASDLRRAGFPFLLAGGSSMSDVVVPRIGYLTSSQFVWSFLWKTLRISRYRTFTASFWHWKLNSAISFLSKGKKGISESFEPFLITPLPNNFRKERQKRP